MPVVNAYVAFANYSTSIASEYRVVRQQQRPDLIAADHGDRQ